MGHFDRPAKSPVAWSRLRGLPKQSATAAKAGLARAGYRLWIRRSWVIGLSLAGVTVYGALFANIVDNVFTGVVITACVYGGSAIVVLSVDTLQRRTSPGMHVTASPWEAGFLEAERQLAARKGSDLTWYSDANSRWFNQLFAFWWKCVPVAASSIRYVPVGDTLRAEDYVGVPPLTIEQPYKKKAAIVDISSLGTDVVREIRYRPLDWELTEYARRHPTAFRAQNPTVSAFGFDLSPAMVPYPSGLCVHCVVETGDGWVLFSLRGRRNVAFVPTTWSATFEEQVEVGSRLREKTVAATALRGLKEEYGIDGFQDASCMLIGREAIADRGASGRVDGLVMNGAVVVAVRLACDLKDVWDALRHSEDIRDPDEHIAWMACRFDNEEDVFRTLKDFGDSFGPSLIDKRQDASIRKDVLTTSQPEVFRESGFSWHPTAKARLLLWSQLAVAEGRLAKSRHHKDFEQLLSKPGL